MKTKLNPSKKRPQAGRTRALAVAPRSASVQPPIDNEHVAPGCQLFASQPVPKGWKFSDAERLDFLDSQVWPDGKQTEPQPPILQLVVKLSHDPHGEWANCAKNARQTIDEAMRASWPNKAL
jgi:hypothetical protein